MRRLSWLRNVPWGAVVLTLLVLAGIVAVAATQWDSRTDFPDVLLNAIGLILTALVFLLGLAQNRLHRTADAVLEEARRSEDAMLDAHLSHPRTVRTMDLWEIASDMRDAMREDTGSAPSQRRRRLVLRAVREADPTWTLPARLDRAVRLYQIGNELDREPGDEGYPSERRRRYLERERGRELAEDEEQVWAAAQAGLTVYGYRRLRARLRVALYTVRSLVSLARVFSVLMAALVILGAIYAGWGIDRVLEPEAWAAWVLIALAVVYSHVVVRDLTLEEKSADLALSGAVLMRLSDAETGMGMYWEALEQTPAQRRSLDQMMRFHLQDVLRRAPQLPWLTSLRGRVHLMAALKAADSIVDGEFAIDAMNDLRRTELRVALRSARQLLDGGDPRTDDPIALLAVSRLYALLADLVECDLLGGDLPGGGGHDDVASWRSASHDRAEQALELLSDLPMFSESFFGHAHLQWLADQTYLWPEEGPLRDRLVAVLRLDPSG